MPDDALRPPCQTLSAARSVPGKSPSTSTLVGEVGWCASDLVWSLNIVLTIFLCATGFRPRPGRPQTNIGRLQVRNCVHARDEAKCRV